ncbi:hypothetical protein ACFQS6_07225 [Xanthomonas populi]
MYLSDVCAADRADDPRLAYRFARAAELTRSYVDRDKHFDWEHTIEAITTLSPSTAPAIMSRWRDRRFGEPERFFPQLVDVLCKRGDLDCRDAAALVCFEGYWDWPGLVTAALDAAGSRPEKDKLLAQFYRFLRFSTSSRRFLKEVANVVQARGLNAQPFRELEERAERSESDPDSHQSSVTSGRESSPDWDAVFAGIDLASASGLLESQARMPERRFGRWREEWIDEAIGRVQVGRERAFVESLEAVDDWSPYAVRGLLEQIPAIWMDGLASRQALASFVRRMARDHATSLEVNRHYQSLSYELVFEKTGVSRQELLRCALEAIAETSLPTTSRDFFQLVAVLAQFLDPVEARSALSYGLEHLEETLGCEQGDGQWSPRLAPTGAVARASQAISGPLSGQLNRGAGGRRRTRSGRYASWVAMRSSRISSSFRQAAMRQRLQTQASTSIECMRSSGC